MNIRFDLAGHFYNSLPASWRLARRYHPQYKRGPKSHTGDRRSRRVTAPAKRSNPADIDEKPANAPSFRHLVAGTAIRVHGSPPRSAAPLAWSSSTVIATSSPGGRQVATASVLPMVFPRFRLFDVIFAPQIIRSPAIGASASGKGKVEWPMPRTNRKDPKSGSARPSAYPN